MFSRIMSVIKAKGEWLKMNKGLLNKMSLYIGLPVILFMLVVVYLATSGGISNFTIAGFKTRFGISPELMNSTRLIIGAILFVILPIFISALAISRKSMSYKVAALVINFIAVIFISAALNPTGSVSCGGKKRRVGGETTINAELPDRDDDLGCNPSLSNTDSCDECSSSFKSLCLDCKKDGPSSEACNDFWNHATNNPGVCDYEGSEENYYCNCLALAADEDPTNDCTEPSQVNQDCPAYQELYDLMMSSPDTASEEYNESLQTISDKIALCEIGKVDINEFLAEICGDEESKYQIHLATGIMPVRLGTQRESFDLTLDPDPGINTKNNDSGTPIAGMVPSYFYMFKARPVWTNDYSPNWSYAVDYKYDSEFWNSFGNGSEYIGKSASTLLTSDSNKNLWNVYSDEKLGTIYNELSSGDIIYKAQDIQWIKNCSDTGYCINYTDLKMLSTSRDVSWENIFPGRQMMLSCNAADSDCLIQGNTPVACNLHPMTGIKAAAQGFGDDDFKGIKYVVAAFKPWARKKVDTCTRIPLESWALSDSLHQKNSDRNSDGTGGDGAFGFKEGSEFYELGTGQGNTNYDKYYNCDTVADLEDQPVVYVPFEAGSFCKVIHDVDLSVMSHHLVLTSGSNQTQSRSDKQASGEGEIESNRAASYINYMYKITDANKTINNLSFISLKPSNIRATFKLFTQADNETVRGGYDFAPSGLSNPNKYLSTCWNCTYPNYGASTFVGGRLNILSTNALTAYLTHSYFETTHIMKGVAIGGGTATKASNQLLSFLGFKFGDVNMMRAFSPNDDGYTNMSSKLHEFFAEQHYDRNIDVKDYRTPGYSQSEIFALAEILKADNDFDLDDYYTEGYMSSQEKSYMEENSQTGSTAYTKYQYLSTKPSASTNSDKFTKFIPHLQSNFTGQLSEMGLKTLDELTTEEEVPEGYIAFNAAEVYCMAEILKYVNEHQEGSKGSEYVRRDGTFTDLKTALTNVNDSTYNIEGLAQGAASLTSDKAKKYANSIAGQGLVMTGLFVFTDYDSTFKSVKDIQTDDLSGFSGIQIIESADNPGRFPAVTQLGFRDLVVDDMSEGDSYNSCREDYGMVPNLIQYQDDFNASTKCKVGQGSDNWYDLMTEDEKD